MRNENVVAVRAEKSDCLTLKMEAVNSCEGFDIVCTAHCNQLYKQTNKMQLLYVFILQFLYKSACFEDHFVHHQKFMICYVLQLCTDHSNVSNCSVLRL